MTRREVHLVVRRAARLRLDERTVGAARDGRCSSRRIRRILCKDERIVVGIARREWVARCVAFIVHDEAAIGIRNRPTRYGEFVSLDLVAGRGAPCPCGIVRPLRRRIGRGSIVLELESIGIDIARRMSRVVVRVDDELVVAKRALLRPDGRIRVRRPLHKANAVLIVHEGEETLLVGLRRKAVGRQQLDLHARPVDLIRRAARDLEQGVADRLVHKVEIRLAKVFHAAHGDILPLDVQRVVRHDIVCHAAIAAVQKYAAHREIVCPERDRISRRLARITHFAAVDIHTRAERAARNRDAIARRLARRCSARCRIACRSAAMDFYAVAERAIRDRDLVIRRIARTLGIAAVDCRIVADRTARDIDFVRLRVARRYGMRLVQRILCDIAARDLSICADRTAREVECIALRLGVRARIHGDRMRLIHGCAREEVLPLRPAAVCLPDRAARDRERIVLRAAVLRNRIARARRRMRARRDRELIVLRRIAVDGDARIRALRG